MQPLGIHHAQVAHVALVGAQQPVVHHAGRLAVEQHGGGVDGHPLVRAQRAVGAVGPQLGRVHEQAVRQAAPHARRVAAARLQGHRQLWGQGVRNNSLHARGDTALLHWALFRNPGGFCCVRMLGIQLEWMLIQTKSQQNGLSLSFWK